MMERIREGDIVLHKPTGERWWVLGVNYKKDKLCIAGWPPTIAKISDCELASKGDIKLSPQELLHRTKEFGDDWDGEVE